MPLQRVDKFILTALLLVNAGLKLCWLGVNELSGDEPFTVFWAQQKTNDLLEMFRDENNPPLYFFLLKWWSASTPFEVPWLRVPSAVFSTLAVWPLFLLARKHMSTWAAATACLLFTFCNEHYSYAHEVRAYSLLTLLTVTGMWQVERLARKAPRAMLWLVMVNTALAYTHFMGWAAIGIQVLCLFIVPEWRQALRPWLKSLALTVVLFIPYGFIFLQRVGASVSNGTWLTSPAWDEPYSMLWRWSNAPVVTVLFLCVIALALWRVRLKHTTVRIGLVWAGVPLIGLFMVSFAVPVYLDRYLVWAAPGFALLVAASLSVIAVNSKVVGGSLVVACAAMLLTFTPWKGNGLRPSAVAKQVREWSGDQQPGFIVLPYWYTLTWAGNEDLNSFRDPWALDVWREMGRSGIGTIWGFSERDSVIVFVDADPDHLHATDTRTWLRANYPRVDSVEADKKVWVYRFRK